jgi:1-acyl-sn-glycerol-3-phosphate acyltransferase/long-chain acyl-CoA synthetase
MVYCPIKIEGLENLPKNGFLLCSNHSSHLDTAALIVASKKSIHNCAMLAAQDYFFKGNFKEKLILALMALIPVNRHARASELKKLIQHCRDMIEQKQAMLVMYPEGTRTLTGEIQDFKPGPVWLAKKMEIPVVPAYIDGTYRSLPKGLSWPRPKRVTVYFGAPISLPKEKLSKENQK